MEKAIKIAIESGYEIKGLEIHEGELFAFRKMESFTDLTNKLVLDPLFWQALGKGLGWDKEPSTLVRNSRLHPKGFPMTQWENEWIMFIMHLAEGGDINSYFEKLLV